MQAKTIEIILKVIETIASIFIQSKSKGGSKNDGTGSSKKK
jgi:hypothetical protein